MTHHITPVIGNYSDSKIFGICDRNATNVIHSNKYN